MAKARQVWTRAICADDKDVITGVQTIRNSLTTVTLFTVAAGYIGARAIPEILLTPDIIQQLNLIQGFLLKAQASKYKPVHWDFEAESLAIMGRAGLLFAIGIRCFFGFGILVAPHLVSMMLLCMIVQPVGLVDFIGTRKTDCFGKTRLVPHVPSSS